MTDLKKSTALLILLVAGMGTAIAQEIRRGETVENRPRPDYDAIGAPVGRFLLYPEATLDFVYDDNIVAADKSTPNLIQSDMVTLLAPAIALRSDWSRNALNVGGRVLGGRYNDYASQDFTDYELWTDGEYEFGPNQLLANVSYSQLHELRTSSDQQQGIFPTEYTLGNVGFGYRFAPNRFFAGVALDFSQYDYDNAIGIIDLDQPVTPGNIGTINNQDRDRLGSDLRLRAGYLISPSYSLYLESRLYDLDYKQKVDRYGNDLDQDGYDIVIGSDFDMTGVTSGQVFVGYRNIDYADTTFQTQNGPTFGASIDWNITRLTTITFIGSQKLYGTNVQNSSGIQAVALGIAVDHELRRNIILSLNLDSVNEEFLQTPREDDVSRIRLGAEYLLNRNWSLNAGYRYQERESNDSNVRQFTVNQFYLGIRGQI